MKREYWMVQYKRAGVMTFHFAETKAEADRVVADLNSGGFYASCWKMGEVTF